MNLNRGLMIVVLFTLAASTLAAEPNPKMIAPLVDEACLLVAHVDLTKVPVDPAFDEAIRFVDALFEGDKQSSESKLQLTMRTRVNVARVTADQLVKMCTGGLNIKEAYVIFSLQDIFPEPAMFVAVPMHDGLDPKKITNLMKTFKLGEPERVGDFLILVLGDARTREPVLDRLKAIQPDARGELAEAFAAIGPAPIRITLTFPKYAKEVFEDVSPRLPAKVGGQSTGELIGTTRWIALGIDPEKVAIRAIVQCDSPEAAKKVGTLLDRAMDAFAKTELPIPLKEQLPKKRLLAFWDDHGPGVQNNRVVWKLGVDEPAGKSLRDLLVRYGARAKIPQRLLPPGIDPQEAADRAMKQYDTDGDGKITGKELDNAPALKAAIKNLDTNKDGAVVRDDIVKRIEAWKKSRVGRMAMQCTVAYRGQPLPDATVVCEPAEFLGDSVPGGRGVTDAHGRVILAIPGVMPPGLAPGLYRVKITSKNVKLPEKYNKKTTLGQEVSIDAARMETGLIFWLD